MKKLLQFLIIYFFCISVSFAQKGATRANHSDSSAIQWTTVTSHNLGEIKLGEPANFTFGFVNVSKEPIVISKGIVSCSCVSIAYTREPVMPGNKGVVKIGYSARTASRFSKSVEVVFNNHERIVLQISGEVIR